MIYPKRFSTAVATIALVMGAGLSAPALAGEHDEKTGKKPYDDRILPVMPNGTAAPEGTLRYDEDTHHKDKKDKKDKEKDKDKSDTDSEE